MGRAFQNRTMDHLNRGCPVAGDVPSPSLPAIGLAQRDNLRLADGDVRRPGLKPTHTLTQHQSPALQQITNR